MATAKDYARLALFAQDRCRYNCFMCLGFLFLFAGCERTENLSQEVLLNTGEKIVVHWVVDYSLQGEAGNPMSIKMRPKQIKTLKFEYGGRAYQYRGGGQIFLLAISPERRPVLVLHPNAFAWNWAHKYKCTTPYYAQLNFGDGGEGWDIPTSIEPWLYGLRGNLSYRIFYLPPSSKPRDALGTIREEYSSEREDRRANIYVDPTYTTSDCIKG